MREHQETLDRLGAVVVGVTFEPPSRVAQFARTGTLPFPVLSDPTRRAYAAFGLQRGRPEQIWNWGTVKVYLRAMLRGCWPHRPRGDLSQLGGDVVVGADGSIALLYQSREPADRPSPEAILAAARNAGRRAAGDNGRPC